MLTSRAAETALSPFGLIKGGDLCPFHPGTTGHYHLGHPLARIDDKIVSGEVDEADLDLSSVIGVYGAGSIGHGHAIFAGKAAAGAYLSLISFREGYIYARRNEKTLRWMEHDWHIDVRLEVHSCGKGRCISGEIMLRPVYDLELDSFN